MDMRLQKYLVREYHQGINKGINYQGYRIQNFLNARADKPEDEPFFILKKNPNGSFEMIKNPQREQNIKRIDEGIKD